MHNIRFTFALTIAAVLLPSLLRAQISFQRTYGGAGTEEGYSVQPTSDSGYIICGSTESYGACNADVWLIKTNAYGDTLWTRTKGGSGWDEGYSVEQTSDGGYIIAGCTSYFEGGPSDVYLIRTDANGSTSWTKAYGGDRNDQACSVRQTTDGGYIVAGSTWSFGVDTLNVWLLKTDTNGDTTWTRRYGTGWDFAGSVQQTADGGYIVVGSTHGGADVYLIKTKDNGDTLWTRTYGGTSIDEGNAVEQTSDGGYIITGYTRSSGAGYNDVYLIKTDGNGDTAWTRTFGGSGADDGRAVHQTADGGYVVAGYTGSFGAGSYDVFLVRTSSTGETLWTRCFGDTNHDGADWAELTADGGYIIVGYTVLANTNSDVWLIKTDSLGNVGMAEEMPRSRTAGCRSAATVVRNLPQGAAAFDAMGRRVTRPKPGIYFLRTTITAAPRKVLLLD